MHTTTGSEARTTDRTSAVVVALLVLLISAAVVLGHAVSGAEAAATPAPDHHASVEAAYRP